MRCHIRWGIVSAVEDMAMEPLMSMKMMSVATSMAMPRVISVSMTVAPIRVTDGTVVPMCVPVSSLSTSDACAVRSNNLTKNCHHQKEAGQVSHGVLRR